MPTNTQESVLLVKLHVTTVTVQTHMSVSIVKPVPTSTTDGVGKLAQKDIGITKK
jgi:hypothetical protein